MADPNAAALSALERLSAALATADAAARAAAARQAAADLAALSARPRWLPDADYLFYLGLAQFHARDAAAEAALTRVPGASVCLPEAQWVLSRLYTDRLSEQNADTVRPQLHSCYRRIAELCPYSPLAQYVADLDTDHREAQLGGPSGPVTLPETKLGTRYDPETLTQVADLFEQQALLEEAARAHGWRVRVRYPEEWLQAGVAPCWEAASDCHARRGDRILAARTLAKCYALGLGDEGAADVSERLRELLEPSDVQPEQPEPDPATLAQIGDLLTEMQMFDDALRVYAMARDAGGEVALPVAAVREARAQFLLDYRSERTAAAVLFGAPLTWTRVTQAWQEARAAYARVEPPSDESAAGLRRCEAALARLEALRARDGG